MIIRVDYYTREVKIRVRDSVHIPFSKLPTYYALTSHYDKYDRNDTYVVVSDRSRKKGE